MRPAKLAAALLLVAAGGGCATAPRAGTGDLAFRLLWQGQSDLDLHVEDPAGEHLYFGHREAASGGVLDVDCNAGTGRLCARPLENVFWREGGAPDGEYRVWVRAHAVIPAEAPVAFTLLVLDGERVVARRQGALAAADDRFGPLAVAYPPAGEWRLHTVAEAEEWRTPWLAYRCPDGTTFRFQPRPERPRLEIDGRVVVLEPVGVDGILYRSGEVVVFLQPGEIGLSLGGAAHGGCRPVGS